MHVTPTQASQLMLESVRTEDSRNPATAATAMKIAVQAPWSDSAFSAVETETKADPATKIESETDQPVHI